MRQSPPLVTVAVLLGVALLAACGDPAPARPTPSSTVAAPASATSSPTTSTGSSTTTTSAPTSTRTSAPRGTTATPTATTSTTAPPTRTAGTTSPRRSTSTTRTTPTSSLVGSTTEAWAFAPLSDCGSVTVEGDVDWQPAWSTSKVLVVSAYLKSVAGGDPASLSSTQRDLIHRALSVSDGEAITALHEAIPGGSWPVISTILRSIGDRTTWMPNRAMSKGEWSIREQIRFLCALHRGSVVNAGTSRYVLSQMHPAASQSWGLGTVGASAFKGGWIGTGRPTRQMGLLDGYAVAMITEGRGPVVLQSDGDSAHVSDMNRLAALLHRRLS